MRGRSGNRGAQECSGRRSWSRVAAVHVWLGLIFSLSSIPSGPPTSDCRSPTSWLIRRVWCARALFGYARRLRTTPGRAALAGALLGLGVGAIDELYQRGTPGRESSPFDTVADTAGAMLGSWFAHKVATHRARTGKS